MSSKSKGGGKRQESGSCSPDPTANKRSRPKVTRACDQCRRNKIRCTGALPCAHCVQHKAECTYDKPYSRGKAPEPKSATQNEQKAYLEKFGHAPGTSGSSSTLKAASRADDNHEQPDAVEDGLALLEEFGSLSQIASRISSKRSTSVRQKTVEPTWNEPAPAASTFDTLDRESKTLTYGDAPMPSTDSAFLILPPMEKARKMLNAYFEKTSGTFQILHRPQVERDMDDLYSNAGLTEDNKSKNGTKATIFIVFALSVEPKHEKLDIGYKFFNISTDLLSSSTGRPDHNIVSAYLLQSFFLLSRSRPIQSYHILGSVITLIFRLNYQRKSLKSLTIPDETTLECIKRAFWGAYSLDKYFSASLGRPMLLKDDDIDQDLPGTQAHYQFTLQVSLTQITSHILKSHHPVKRPSVQFLLASTRNIHKNILAFHQQLEASISKLAPRQSTILRLGHLGNMMILHLPFLMESFAPGDQTHWSIEQCVQTVSEICSIIDSLAAHQQMISWLERYCAYCACLVLYIYILTQSSTIPLTAIQTHLSTATKCHEQIHPSSSSPEDQPLAFSARCSTVLSTARAEVLSHVQTLETQSDFPLTQTVLQAFQPTESSTHAPSSHFHGEWSDMQFDQEAPGGGVLTALLSLVGGVNVRDWDWEGAKEKEESIVERIRKSGWTGLLGY